MEIKKSQIYGLIISLLLLVSCNDDIRKFHSNIRNKNDCVLSCTITSPKQPIVTIVVDKSKLIYILNKNNEMVNEEVLIDHIENKTPIIINSQAYLDLFPYLVITQNRVDSVIEQGIDNLFILNSSNDRVLKGKILDNQTIMEDRYLIKRLFDEKILLAQDCESGCYYVIE